MPRIDTGPRAASFPSECFAAVIVSHPCLPPLLTDVNRME